MLWTKEASALEGLSCMYFVCIHSRLDSVVGKTVCLELKTLDTKRCQVGYTLYLIFDIRNIS